MNGDPNRDPQAGDSPQPAGANNSSANSAPEPPKPVDAEAQAGDAFDRILRDLEQRRPPSTPNRPESSSPPSGEESSGTPRDDSQDAGQQPSPRLPGAPGSRGQGANPPGAAPRDPAQTSESPQQDGTASDATRGMPPAGPMDPMSAKEPMNDPAAGGNPGGNRSNDQPSPAERTSSPMGGTGAPMPGSGEPNASSAEQDPMPGVNEPRGGGSAQRDPAAGAPQDAASGASQRPEAAGQTPRPGAPQPPPSPSADPMQGEPMPGAPKAGDPMANGPMPGAPKASDPMTGETRPNATEPKATGTGEPQAAEGASPSAGRPREPMPGAAPMEGGQTPPTEGAGPEGERPMPGRAVPGQNAGANPMNAPMTNPAGANPSAAPPMGGESPMSTAGAPPMPMGAQPSPGPRSEAGQNAGSGQTPRADEGAEPNPSERLPAPSGRGDGGRDQRPLEPGAPQAPETWRSPPTTPLRRPKPTEPQTREGANPEAGEVPKERSSDPIDPEAKPNADDIPDRPQETVPMQRGKPMELGDPGRRDTAEDRAGQTGSSGQAGEPKPMEQTGTPNASGGDFTRQNSSNSRPGGPTNPQMSGPPKSPRAQDRAGQGEQEQGEERTTNDDVPSNNVNDQPAQKGSGSSGDQSGSKNSGAGPGQRANRQGSGAAGQHTGAEEGAGSAPEPGQGESSLRGGNQQPGDGSAGGAADPTRAGRGQAGRPQNTNAPPGAPGPGGTPENRPMDPNRPEGMPPDPMGTGEARPNDPPSKEPTDPQDPQSPPGQGAEGEGRPGDQSGQERPTQGGGGTPADVGGQRPAGPDGKPVAQPLTGGDEANLDYARKATDLALDHLRNELTKPDGGQELLDQLGWTRDQARQFLDRWQRLKAEANEPGAEAVKAQRELDETLRSLGLRPRGVKRAAAAGEGDAQRQLRDARRFEPPADIREQFQEYTRGRYRRPENSPARGASSPAGPSIPTGGRP
jgi:hypothetical protein